MVNHQYLYLSARDLEIEKEQLADEGKDLSPLEDEFEKFAGKNLDSDLSLQPKVKKLLARAQKLPLRDDYPYKEPSSLAGIKKARPDAETPKADGLSDKKLYDCIYGAWLGRASGCLLGKPVEGWKTERMWGYLRDGDHYPLNDYFTSEVPKDIAERYDIRPEGAYIDQIDYMPEDDDTNYTVIGLALIQKHGLDFTPADVANFWLENIPILHTYTAERAAYRNFIQLIPPPESARCCNPYREWIGAQIRGDFFGYLALGNPELAAELAWRDACISHIKNGIYGEMWVAAMLAAAPLTTTIDEVITAGLTQIPENSRLAEAVQTIMDWHRSGLDYEAAVRRIHNRWDENNSHHWCHTISNAEIVTLALLYSDLDFGLGICRAVQPCFDTDCNGATVGSILGMMLGAEKLPYKWIAPLNNTMATGVAGYQKVKISKLAEDTVKLITSHM